MTVIDVEKLVAANQGRSSNQCQTCRWVESREPAEQAKWDRVMADPKRWQHAAIHRSILALVEAGGDDAFPAPGRGSIENHRTQMHRRPL